MYASMGTLCNFGAGEFVEIARALSALPNLVIWKLAPGDLPGNATVASLKLGANVRVRTDCPPSQFGICYCNATDHGTLAKCLLDCVSLQTLCALCSATCDGLVWTHHCMQGVLL